jgi:ABC-type multidrug transport system ATPase subunit
MASETVMIDIENLSKSFGKTAALSEINLEMGHGIIGLIGPNGAGKTTLLRILVTLLQPSQGEVRIAGHSVQTEHGRQSIRQMIGYLPQFTASHEQLTVEQNLDYFLLLKRVENSYERSNEIRRVLNLVNLSEVQHTRYKKLSGGTKRRVGVALALLNDPQLLVIDEPTTGLDPKERAGFRTLLSQISGERTVILSSHIIEDVEQIADHVVILHQGKIRFAGAPSALLQQIEGKKYGVSAKNMPNVWRLTSSASRFQGRTASPYIA